MLDKKYKCDMCNKEIEKWHLCQIYMKYEKSLKTYTEVPKITSEEYEKRIRTTKEDIPWKMNYTN